jgi:hypothetical protein
MEEAVSPNQSVSQECPSPSQQEPTPPKNLTPPTNRATNRSVGAFAKGPILSTGAGHATRIPPGLQAKMAAASPSIWPREVA